MGGRANCPYGDATRMTQMCQFFQRPTFGNRGAKAVPRTFPNRFRRIPRASNGSVGCGNGRADCVCSRQFALVLRHASSGHRVGSKPAIRSSHLSACLKAILARAPPRLRFRNISHRKAEATPLGMFLSETRGLHVAKLI